MKIAFVSNYINHHQIPFCNAMNCLLDGDFTFVQTEPMEQERVQMGWDDTGLPGYVKCFYEEPECCKALIMDADVVVFGGTDDESYITERLASGKPVVRYSERLYKTGQWKAISPRGLRKKYNDHTKYRNSAVYLLCAGAYVASDFHIVRAYPQKMFCWGYFPETKIFEGTSLWNGKPSLDTVHIVWAGRFMPLKHPEFVVKLASDLKHAGHAFHVHFIGGGEMEEELRSEVKEKGLDDVITMYGFLAPAKVREVMEQSHIHLFTRNHLGCFGAVVNEVINSGCAEVVNSQVGAAPFLIRHKQNGLVYKEGSYEDFRDCVMQLMENKELIIEYGKAAYETIVSEWNAENAASQVVRFYENWKQGIVEPPKSGPLSEAPVISPKKMYGYMTGLQK